MKKVLILFLSFILMIGSVTASISRLYIGELDGQSMAGVDSRVDFGFLYVGGDVRTLIRKTIYDDDETVVGFMPDRTDYKTFIGFAFGYTEIEFAHTCYHRVISSEDLSMYANNQNPEDTDTITIRYIF